MDSFLPLLEAEAASSRPPIAMSPFLPLVEAKASNSVPNGRVWPSCPMANATLVAMRRSLAAYKFQLMKKSDAYEDLRTAVPAGSPPTPSQARLQLAKRYMAKRELELLANCYWKTVRQFIDLLEWAINWEKEAEQVAARLAESIPRWDPQMDGDVKDEYLVIIRRLNADIEAFKRKQRQYKKLHDAWTAESLRIQAESDRGGKALFEIVLVSGESLNH